jgi:hypothetical protein
MKTNTARLGLGASVLALAGFMSSLTLRRATLTRARSVRVSTTANSPLAIAHSTRPIASRRPIRTATAF